MKTLWLIIAGVTGGILGGMGFGGGTLLIPILVFLLSVPYKVAAWVNLVVFLPTALVALVFHVKNKMVEWRYVFYLLPFGLTGVVGGYFIAGKVSEQLLRFCFGLFIIIVGVISIFFVLLGFFKKKYNNQKILHK